jgi:phospholipase/carboxylesterase
MPQDTPEALVILLHGVGASGADLLGLAEFWKPLLPGAVFVAPNAPEPFPYGGGWQWYSMETMSEADRSARVVAARQGFDALVGRIVAEHGMGSRLKRVALVGFSQGAIMTLDAIAAGRWPVACAVSLSGRLATEPPFTPSPDVPVLLLHGADDPVIPSSSTETAAARLAAVGVPVSSRIYPGLGHGISDEEVAVAGSFLLKHLEN